MPHEELPYWNFNIPVSERTEECPAFLLTVSDKDRRHMGQWDSDFERQSWSVVRGIIETNSLIDFLRVPSEVRKYRQYLDLIKREHGSVAQYMLQERLRWEGNVTPTGAPFTAAEDLKILYNDWPYGIDERAVHLVVWAKFELEDDPFTGQMTPESRELIERYIDKTFRARMGPDRVLWFRNGKSLKSVRALEHFHVMLLDPAPSFVEEITCGDVPMCKRLGAQQ